MSSPSKSSPSSDVESESSTIVYDHEPFVTFRSRVLAIAITSIWPGSTPNTIVIERMRGGGFNRIIGLTQHHPGAQPDANTRYILRTPRFDAAQVHSEVAVLQFLHQHTKIPAPEVVTYDETHQNALGYPFAVQIRIPGTDLHSSFPKLRHNERCSVARELGDIYRQMLAVRSSVAGKLALSNDHKRLGVPLCVAPLRLMDAESLTPYSDSPATESVHELLTANFQAQKARRLERFPTDFVTPEFMDKFCQMTSELDAGGWLASTHYSIAHLDLAPRNILVNPTQGEKVPIISGVLDWDNAVLAPMFMSCAPPMWIWAWQDDDEEDERCANDRPPTSEGRELKLLFEEAAGHDYVRFAYESAYRLARRLVRFAIDGIPSSEDFEEAETMLQEWEDIYQARKDGIEARNSSRDN
ncbi:hypothetical protein G7Z17_g3722 [Cylindrodendrum hubeiense]|uniref:Aminoglycoside phosphotransferase domain-containing protein n=1 Tax=Cylindrodendrum hubeiense TaxID=595255 RepID=A0A9P5HFC4_9HYPO|nr:hypothetical protein G7Z17_g3722 [Cylindrodendrum hubeiense]